MANAKFVKTAAAVALGASVVTTAVAPGAASAATSYKIKDGKLYKNGKIAKGYVVYKGTLYKNGKKNKGYAKVGTGSSMKLYYNTKLKKGFKTANNATLLFKDGVLYKGYKQAGSNERLYKDGKLTTGWVVYTNDEGTKYLYNKGYLYTGLKTATRSGVKNLFENGVLAEGEKAYKDELYVDGVLAEGVKEFDGVTYIDGKKDVAKPEITAEDQTIEYGAKDVDVLSFAKVEDNSKEEIKAEAKISFDGKDVEKIDTKKPGVYTVTYTAKDKNGNEAEAKEIKVTVAEATEAVVESVTGVNATTVEVKFSKALDKAAAEAAAVTLQDVSFTGKKLSEDGKTLTLTTSTTIKVTDATLTVPAIKVKDAKDDKDTSAKYVALFTYEDTVAPTVVGATSAIQTVEAKDTDKVVVTFSEPVQALSTIAYVNGTNVRVAAGKNANELELTLGTPAKAGDALEVKLTNVKDLAGNTIEPNPASVSTVVQGAETSAPVVTSVTTKGLEVTFTYDEAVTPANDILKTFVSANGKETGTLTKKSVSEDKKSVTYTVILDGDAKTTYEKDGVFAGTLYVQEGLVTDLAGNKSVASTQSLTLVADKIAPTVVTSEVKDGKLVLTFSEEVESAKDAKVTTSKYNATTGNTEKAKYAVFAVSTKDPKVVTIDLPAATAEDTTYKVNFTKGTFTDTAKNEVAAYATQVVVPKTDASEVNDTQAPTITLGYGEDTKLASENGNYTITFNVEDVKKENEVASALDFSTILNASNYTLGGKALPTGAEITTNATSAEAMKAEVTITIPKTAVKENIDGFLTVTGIKDAKGNTVTSIEATKGKLQLAEGVAPELTSAVVNADGSITVAFSEKIKSETDLTKDVIVTADGEQVTGTFKEGTGSDFGKYVFTAEAPATIKDAKKLTVKTAADTTTTDEADNKLVANKEITVK